MIEEQHLISTEADLEKVIGEAPEFLRAKVVTALDEPMLEFISRAPLVFISTEDADGGLDISPKGDAPGFVQFSDAEELLIPERPGNKLTFGFKNLLRNPQIGLIFVAPNMRETLRVKGRATISKDPKILNALQAQGKPAILCTVVEVDECFFHCGKAMIRSKMWQPDEWAEPGPALMVRQATEVIMKDPSLEAVVEQEIERSYRDDLY